MKEIDEQKNQLLREISLPTFEDNRNYNSQNVHSNQNRKKLNAEIDRKEEGNLKDISIFIHKIWYIGNAINEIFIHRPNEILKTEEENENSPCNYNF